MALVAEVSLLHLHFVFFAGSYQITYSAYLNVADIFPMALGVLFTSRISGK